MPEIYRELGLREVVNCATTYTRLGGSVMHPDVAQAMADAAGTFVNIWDLQDAIGDRLARLTHNEAAYVSNGAAAALALATAACMTGEDLSLMARLPMETQGMKNEVVVHRRQRNWYDIAIRQVGVKLVEIGHGMETFDWEIDAAINERTAAVVYFAGSHFGHTPLPLEYVIERAHARGVPVIVDAAAQVPPVSNLWHYTRDLGADLAIFSGGKNLRGPQNSGLAVGSRKIVRAMRLNGPPHQRIGRSMKMSKEAMVGLLRAIERYLATDHDAELSTWSAVVDLWMRAWAPKMPPGMTIIRDDINEAGEPIPRVIMRWSEGSTFERDDLIAAMRADDPIIEVVHNDRTSVAFSPHLLLPGQAQYVAERVPVLIDACLGASQTLVPGD